MNRMGCVVAACVAATLAGAMPARAADLTEAEQLRGLDVMLMVTSLRCRTTPDDFQEDFQRFEAGHLAILNEAASDLRSAVVVSGGPADASRAVDRLSTRMANRYGQGHPWLGCAQLKLATRILAGSEGRAALVEAADQLLAPARTEAFAFAGP